MQDQISGALIALVIASIGAVTVFIVAGGKWIESRVQSLQEKSRAKDKLEVEEKQKELEQRFKESNVIVDSLKQQGDNLAQMISYVGRLVSKMDEMGAVSKSTDETLNLMSKSTNDHQILVSETLGNLQEAIADGNTGLHGKLDRLITELSGAIEIINKSPAQADTTMKILTEIRDTLVKKVHDTGEMKPIVIEEANKGAA